MTSAFTPLLDYLSSKWTDIVAILLLFSLGKILLQMIVSKLIKLSHDDDPSHGRQREKQAETLGQVVLTTGNVVIYAAILLMILNLFMVDVTPILAGAGVVGIAVGFGAQTLVKDLISGLFTLIEHRYSLGDEVTVDGFKGRVVKATMRSTILKDESGDVFYISNGNINKVQNHSQGKYFE